VFPNSNESLQNNVSRITAWSRQSVIPYCSIDDTLVRGSIKLHFEPSQTMCLGMLHFSSQQDIRLLWFTCPRIRPRGNCIVQSQAYVVCLDFQWIKRCHARVSFQAFLQIKSDYDFGLLNDWLSCSLICVAFGLAHELLCIILFPQPTLETYACIRTEYQQLWIVVRPYIDFRSMIAYLGN